jgi:acetylornithine deacetylase
MDSAALLQSLVAIPSVSGSEGALVDHLSKLLAAEGFRIQRLGNSLWFEVGEGAPRLLFLSHLDTIPPCEGWTTDPLKPVWENGHLHGLGANDAKGCVTALIAAAISLAKERVMETGTAIFAFACEEETEGRGTQTILPHLGTIDAAVVCEPTGLQVCTAQRGRLVVKCTARGTSAHAAHARLGENAIHKASRDIAKLETITFEPHALLGVTCPVVTTVNGGRVRNQVPDHCEFIVDIRTTPNLREEDVLRRIAGELESSVTIISSEYCPRATEPSEPVVRAALQASSTSSSAGSNTTSDWVFLGDIPAVKAGPGDTHRSHRPDEWIALSELEAGAAFYANLARTYFHIKASEAVHV